MAERGLLKEDDDSRYKITTRGELLYKLEKDESYKTSYKTTLFEEKEKEKDSEWSSETSVCRPQQRYLRRIINV